MRKTMYIVLSAIILSSCQERSQADLKTIEHFHQINIEDRKQGFMRDTSYAEAVREFKVGRSKSSTEYDSETNYSPWLFPLILSAVLLYYIGKNNSKK
jgi:hypothetical protein